jgi:MoaA/NifB/PqqE/SkfB family radical SAM enzyme
MLEIGYTIDIELTNRCNAKCGFCPRDMTPHQGLMTPEVFDQALARAVEYKDIAERLGLPGEVQVSLCGLGEPLLNKHHATFTRQVREAGMLCMMSSNAALLDERRGSALLEAGLQRVLLNVGDIGDEYEDIYKLPFEKTRDNVVRFNEMAGDDCQVWIILVDHHQDPEHIQRMKDYWADQGVHLYMEFEIMNRGGALFVDHMQYEDYPEQATARQLLADSGSPPYCVVPFIGTFVGYDGQYYLCCSDWTKKVPLGSVFDESIVSILRPKLETTLRREPICLTCNHDPINRITDVLRSINAGEVAQAHQTQLLEDMDKLGRTVDAGLELLDPGITALAADAASYEPKKRIPVTVR